MNKFMLLSAIFISTIAYSTPAPSPQPSAGKLFIESTKTALESKELQKFLRESKEEYIQGKKAFLYDEIIEERLRLDEAYSHQLATEHSEKTQALQQKLCQLHKKKMEKLGEIAKKYPESRQSLMIQNLTATELSDEQTESFRFYDGLSLKAKGSGKTPLENKLIEIDLEYWIREIALQDAIASGAIHHDKVELYSTALEMRKLEEMKAAAESDPNSKEAQAIFTVWAAHPTVAAALYDIRHLQDGSTPLDQEIHAILHAEKNDSHSLLSEYFHE